MKGYSQFVLNDKYFEDHLEHLEDVFEEIEGGGKAGVGRKTPGKAR